MIEMIKKKVVEIAKTKETLIEIAKELKIQMGVDITLPTIAVYLKGE